MNDFEDQNLPPELGQIAKQLRDNRHEASALELDKAKQRVMRRVSAPRDRAGRFGWLRKPTGVVAALVLAMTIGGGTALALTHHSLAHRIHVHTVQAHRTPLLGSGTPITIGGFTPGPSAGRFQYGNPFLIFIQQVLAVIGQNFPPHTNPGAIVSGILAALHQLLSSLGIGGL